MSPPPDVPAQDSPWRRLWRWSVRRRYGLGAAAVCAVFALSSIPNTHPPRFRGLDKVEHVAEYFLLALALLNLTTRGYTRMRPRWLLATWCATVALSLLDETYQRWIPGRSFDLRDVAASALGSLAALAAVLLVRALLVRPGPPRP